MRREDLYNVYLEIKGTDGKVVRFQCDKMTGAAAKGKDLKYRPANGLESQLSLGGPKSVDNTTITRLYDTTVDPWIHWLYSQCSRAAVAVTRQPLDENGHPFGQALNFTGKLMDVTPPPTDSESDKAALIEFACSLESNVG
jgi:hypothetical protein